MRPTSTTLSVRSMFGEGEGPVAVYVNSSPAAGAPGATAAPPP
jgi:hypothetical protein